MGLTAGVCDGSLRPVCVAVASLLQPIPRNPNKSFDKLNQEGVMRARASVLFLFGILACGAATKSGAQANVVQFVSFDVPGATLTRAIDVNGSGEIVGRFDDQNGTHGFLYSGGQFTTIDFPGSNFTIAIGINDSGQIVGRFMVNGEDHGFLFSNGLFVQIDVPGAVSTECHGINSTGDIVGRQLTVKNSAQGGGSGRTTERGYLLHAGQFTSIDFPNADTTDAWKIADDGRVVGDWSDSGTLRSGSLHGYIFNNGQFTSFDDPGVTGTAPREINSVNQVVGISLDKKLNDHGFILMGGVYQGFDFPGSSFTDGNGINDQGMIVGGYIDSNGAQHGYAALVQ